MPTVKLVVIGSSGVGKTSLRGKYISGRFSTGYRATIGADFITKTLPHPTRADQSVTLQIWDTAGQERFSSLSTAFFRGADAAILMFDVNTPETMLSLKKWWAEFCDRAPVLSDADMNEYCCVVVGNKVDMIGKGDGEGPVSESEALQFLDELVPPLPAASPSSEINVLPPESPNGYPENSLQRNHSTLSLPQDTRIQPPPSSPSSSSLSSQIHLSEPTSNLSNNARSPSIAIAPRFDTNNARGTSHSPKHHLSKSRSRSSSRFYSGTMTTTHTALTIYHTPSSSLFDTFHSARSSPEPHLVPGDQQDTIISPPGSVRRRRMTTLSTGSASSDSAPTITPSLFARENGHASSSSNTNSNASTSPRVPSTLSAHSVSPLIPPLPNQPLLCRPREAQNYSSHRPRRARVWLTYLSTSLRGL
ncbi:P-loop containing nucleoside triphosphate hydrolase protein [Gymnopilus junonius]|uniref:P-loop containing nucleoside triphosphate hydrolase protein n=1 Tax=Gymnopilus junonius TaxID=109634 RepID=A0A9P5NME9_GYMJU|nr:P-loop containing nucleoside triphosphate hydrolase protein [Gymnopilus junonius]